MRRKTETGESFRLLLIPGVRHFSANAGDLNRSMQHKR